MPDILHQFQVSASPQSVFDAIAFPEGLNAWWTLEAEGRPVANEAYRFYFGPEYDWRGNVMHVIDGTELTWRFTDAMDDWNGTRVGFRLSGNQHGCSVYFFHATWKEASEHYAISNFCWAQLLNGLKNYVERGEVFPFEQRS